MQTNAFQLDGFQQDGGELTLFVLTATAPVALAGTVTVTGDLALGVSIGATNTLALSGSLSVTGDVQTGQLQQQFSGGYFPDVPRKTKEQVRRERIKLGIIKEKKEEPQTEIEKILRIPRADITDLVRMRAKGELSEVDLELEISALKAKKKRQAEEDILLLM